jgi:hypothetical protein
LGNSWRRITSLNDSTTRSIVGYEIGQTIRYSVKYGEEQIICCDLQIADRRKNLHGATLIMRPSIEYIYAEDRIKLALHIKLITVY